MYLYLLGGSHEHSKSHYFCAAWHVWVSPEGDTAIPASAEEDARKEPDAQLQAGAIDRASCFKVEGEVSFTFRWGILS